jgi:phospholipase/carboxylesterase
MFKYITRPPKKEIKNPQVLFLLHGYGSNEMDLFSFAEYLPDELFIISIRAPKKLDFGGYAWYDIFLDSQNNKISDDQTALERVNELAVFMDQLAEKYLFSNKKMSLLGFSQGAILSYSLALHYPQKFKNVIALSGYINENIMPVQESINDYKNLDFFVSHGIYDDIIPIELARKIPPYLEARKIKYIYKEYPMGHEVNQVCFNDFLLWLKERL